MLPRILLLGLSLCGAAACAAPPPELAGDLGPLPPFALVDEHGRDVRDRSMRGTVWAVNFLFTSCPTACPPLARATAKLRDRVAAWAPPDAKVRIVSVSVDPLTDTPEVLRSWVRRYAADPHPWTLWTGEYAAMEQLVIGGFMQPILRKDRVVGAPSEVTATDAPTPLDTAHSLRFALVDQRGHLRALYDHGDADLVRLDAALRWLYDHPAEAP